MAGPAYFNIIFTSEAPDISAIYKEMKQISGLNSIQLEETKDQNYQISIDDFNGVFCLNCKCHFHIVTHLDYWEFWGYESTQLYLEELFLFIVEKKGAKIKFTNGEIYEINASSILGEKWNNGSKKWRWVYGHPAYYNMNFWRKLFPW